MIGALIGAASSLIGGSMASKAQKEANEMMLADKEKDRALQREFAQTGIQWKVSDAKAAGLHPIFAMGGSGATYTPSSIAITPATGMADGVSRMGQDIGRAINSTRSQSQRNDAFTEATQKLTIQKMGLENDLLASQVAKLNAAPNPPMPVGDRYLVDGQSGSPVVSSLSVPGLVNEQPMKRTVAAPGALHQEPGAVTDVGFARTSNGGYYPVPSDDVKQRIEDNIFHEAAHFMRNNILPAFSNDRWSPPYPAPTGQRWRWSMSDGYYLEPTPFSRRFRFHDAAAGRR